MPVQYDVDDHGAAWVTLDSPETRNALSDALLDELLARLERVPLAAVATDGLVDVTIEGDHQLDVLRDVVAELGLPLHRLSTRLTSLDEVFLDRSGGPR